MLRAHPLALGGSIVRVLSLSVSLSFSLDLSVSGYADSPPLFGLLSIGFLMLQQVMSCLDKDGEMWLFVVLTI